MSHSMMEETPASTSASIDNGQCSFGSTPAVRFETIVIHPFFGEFYKGILDGFILTIHGRTGFVNASSLCTSGQKSYKNWIRNRSNLEFIETVKNEITPKKELVLYRINEGPSNNDINGTYVCERILYRIAQWVSVEFSVKATGILSDFYHHRKRNIGNEDELKEQIKHMNEAHKEVIEEYKKFIEDCTKEVEDCKRKINEYVIEIEVYKEQIKCIKEAHEEEIEGFKRNIEDYEEKLEDYEKKLEDYEETIEDCRRTISEYAIEAEVYREEIEDYKEKNVYLQDKNEQLEDKISQFEQNIADMGVDYVPKLNYQSKRPVFAIIDKGIIRGYFKLTSIRTQELGFRTAFQRIKRKYKNAKILFYSYHPNAITFLNQVRQQFPGIVTRYNDIHLPKNYSVVQFIKDIRKEFTKPPRNAALDASAMDA